LNNPTLYQFNLPKSTKPSEVTLTEPWYPGVQKYWEKCSATRSVDPILGITTIVIHATAGSSSSGAISVLKKPVDPASFHWLVPDEDEPQHGNLVWACVPEARAAWHVRKTVSHPEVSSGAKNINQWSLGIEVVNAQKNDPFSAWQIEATAKIVRYCWAKYPNLVHVVSHARLDPTRREDPGPNFDWARFKALVLNGVNEPVPQLVAMATIASKLKGKAIDSCCQG
jgi:N-acetyl-anhydromuramyl-L-alanine amidase AmpD